MKLNSGGIIIKFGNFSLYHRVQNGSVANSASYSIGTGSSFPGSKAAGAWSWPLNLHLLPRLRMHGAIPPLTQYVFMLWCLV